MIVDVVLPCAGAPGHDRRHVGPGFAGYALYGAISLAVPPLHGAPRLAISWSPGALTLRCPEEMVAVVGRLVGRRLATEWGAIVIVGAPVVVGLMAASTLEASFVTVKSSSTGMDMERADLEAHLRRILSDRWGATSPSILVRRPATMVVAGRVVHGCEVQLDGLAADVSIAVQEEGLGGRRRMGAGFFVPTIADGRKVAGDDE